MGGATADVCHEFDGVAPAAMTGGTIGHAAGIQRNSACSRKRPGASPAAYGSDLKIHVADDHIRYPDGIVVCSPLDPTAKVAHDPVVIFEVLSPSTASTDRIVKAREYQATPSVKRTSCSSRTRRRDGLCQKAQDGGGHSS